MNFFLKRRNELDMSQHDVGVKLGITGGAVGMWEREVCHPPLYLAAELAKVYQVPASRIADEIVRLSNSINTAKEKRGQLRLGKSRSGESRSGRLS